jgi:hypothetical protein
MSLPNYMGCLMQFYKSCIIIKYENPTIITPQVSLSPKQSTLLILYSYLKHLVFHFFEVWFCLRIHCIHMRQNLFLGFPGSVEETHFRDCYYAFAGSWIRSLENVFHFLSTIPAAAKLN